MRIHSGLKAGGTRSWTSKVVQSLERSKRNTRGRSHRELRDREPHQGRRSNLAASGAKSRVFELVLMIR